MKLRTLLLAEEARQDDAWLHTASLMQLIANCHRGPKQRPFQLADFHPNIKREKKRGTRITDENIDLLIEAFCGPQAKPEGGV